MLESTIKTTDILWILHSLVSSKDNCRSLVEGTEVRNCRALRPPPPISWFLITIHCILTTIVHYTQGTLTRITILDEDYERNKVCRKQCWRLGTRATNHRASRCTWGRSSIHWKFQVQTDTWLWILSMPINTPFWRLLLIYWFLEGLWQGSVSIPWFISITLKHYYYYFTITAIH